MKKNMPRDERFFDGLKIKPSLLHGNLWSRNWGADNTGRAVVYDPACYFGHNEMELAMLTLFGGPAKGGQACVRACCASAFVLALPSTQQTRVFEAQLIRRVDRRARSKKNHELRREIHPRE